MTIEHIINNNFKNLDWDSTSEAYYTLDFTPFMEVIYDSVKEYAELMCEKQKELCADKLISCIGKKITAEFNTKNYSINSQYY